MGLYDEDNAAVTAGDVNAEEYWQARAAMAQLEEALATEQPWNAIGTWLPKALAMLDAALAKYPAHAELQAWRSRAAAVDAPIDPDYGNDWKRGFPWSQSKFFKGWVSLHWARHAHALAEPDWNTVRVQARKADTAWEQCHNVHEWPGAAKALLEAGRTEAQALADEAFKHL